MNENLNDTTKALIASRRSLIAKIREALDPVGISVVGTAWGGGDRITITFAIAGCDFLSAESEGLL